MPLFGKHKHADTAAHEARYDPQYDPNIASTQQQRATGVDGTFGAIAPDHQAPNQQPHPNQAYNAQDTNTGYPPRPAYSRQQSRHRCGDEHGCHWDWRWGPPGLARQHLHRHVALGGWGASSRRQGRARDGFACREPGTERAPPEEGAGGGCVQDAGLRDRGGGGPREGGTDAPRACRRTWRAPGQQGMQNANTLSDVTGN